MDINIKKILSKARKCVEDYNMIQDGDKIAVGVSGGKDSLTLLCALSELKKFFPNKFELCAITLDMGFDNVDYSNVQRLCDKIGVEYILEKTDIAQVLFDIRKESNPCSLCAKMRRGGVNARARAAGCNKVALGHHNEDAIETFFLSLFYEGRINCFKTVTYLSKVDLTVIRPLLYVSERDIKGYAKTAQLPIVHNPCPADGYTKRQEMKEYIEMKSKEDRYFKKRITNAIQTGIWKEK